MERTDIADMARHHGLGMHAEALAAIARESIRLKPFEGPADDFGTRLGGRPAVPKDFEWPTWQERPLAFIGQLRLDEIAPRFGLPDRGLLSFFYDADEQPWGFDPKDAGGARVSWFDHGELAISELPSSLPAWATLAGRPVRMSTEWTIPDGGAPEIEALGPIDSESLWSMQDAIGEDETIHRLFGHPDVIQNEMRLEVAYASSGVYVGDPSGYVHPSADEFQRQALEWQLLLQVDSDDLLGTMFGDVGRIYYWIRSDHLAARDFDRVWQILQCG